MDYFYSYERQESVTQDANNTRALSKYYKSEFLFNPVSVGLQIHLGNNQATLTALNLMKNRMFATLEFNRTE